MSNIRVKEFYTEADANIWLAETKYEVTDIKYSTSSGVDVDDDTFTATRILIVYKIEE